VKTHPLLLQSVGVFGTVMIAAAAVQAYHGVRFRHPITIRAIQ
jgi:uncharacterized Tic20 family protein